MKVLLLTDPHIGLTISGYDTRDILKKALDEILEEIEIWQPDLVVNNGDTFHTSTPKPEDYAIIFEFLSAFDVPVIILRGNHDEGNGLRPDAIEPIRRTKFVGFVKDEVAAEFLMYDSEDEEVMTVSDRVICPELPCKITFNEKELLVFPYIAEARAKRMTGHSAQKLVTDLLKENVNKDIVAAFTHLDIRGVVEGSEASVARGATLLLPKTLAGSCAFPFYCGHLHKRQVLKVGKTTFNFPGSLIRTDFSDVDGAKKGFLKIDL